MAACSHDGCVEPTLARGLCPLHYRRFLRSPSSGRPQCSVTGCRSSVWARSLCATHYADWHRETHGRKRHARTCDVCGTAFTAITASARFCSTGAGSCEAATKADGELYYGAVLHPKLRRSPLFNLHREPTIREIAAYKRALKLDPCSYCGGRGGSHDHIVPRSAGLIEDVRDWRNLAGSCRRCNATKQALSLLQALLWIPISRAYHDMRPVLFPRKKAVQATA